MSAISKIIRVPALPSGFARLVAASEREGFQFLSRMQAEWEDGTNRFARPGEALFAAWVDGILCGVCGLNVDPYQSDPSVGRVRRLYVMPANRSSGVGRALVREVIDAGRGHFTVLRLRVADAEGAGFYEKLGFTPSDEPDATHRLIYS